ncbi:hypothetical protein E4U21_003561 [Claviceps maximensis]|nr:hypothetical protein E4U21_003561 [Claviceps maximensis]
MGRRKAKASRRGGSSRRARAAPGHKTPKRAVDDFSDYQGGIIHFELLKDPAAPSWNKGRPAWNYIVPENVPWNAVMTLHVKDVAHMMKHGIYMSSQNADLRGSLIDDLAEDSYRRSLGWRFYRQYVLQDLHQLNPQWKATLHVFSRTFEELTVFRVEDVSFRNIRLAAAKVGDNLVYSFDSVSPEYNFNALFDDLPMKGWWPWPNPEAKTAQDGHRKKHKGKLSFSFSYDWPGEGNDTGEEAVPKPSLAGLPGRVLQRLSLLSPEKRAHCLLVMWDCLWRSLLFLIMIIGLIGTLLQTVSKQTGKETLPPKN